MTGWRASRTKEISIGGTDLEPKVLLGLEAACRIQDAKDIETERIGINPFAPFSHLPLTPERFEKTLSNIAITVVENSAFYPEITQPGWSSKMDVELGLSTSKLDIAIPGKFKLEAKTVTLTKEQRKEFGKTVGEFTELVKRGVYLRGLEDSIKITGREIKDAKGSLAPVDLTTAQSLEEGVTQALRIKTQRLYDLANGLDPKKAEIDARQKIKVNRGNSISTQTVSEKVEKITDRQAREMKLRNVGGALTLSAMALSMAACKIFPEFHPTLTVTTSVTPESALISTEVSPVPTIQPAGTLTESSIKTATPTDTAVPTLERSPTPTMNPQEIAGLVSLNPERTYIITDVVSNTVTIRYLMDTYNNAKMAKWDEASKAWVDTTVEEKYGFMAPLEINPPYIPRQYTYGSNIDPYDRRYISYITNPIFTGNVVEDRWFNPDSNSNITRHSLETVIRDNKGNMHLLYFYIGSPDLDGLKAVVTCNQYGGCIEETGSIDDILKLFKPGEQITAYFYYQWPENILPSRQCYSNGTCRDETRASYYILQDNLQAITELVGNLNDSESQEYRTDQQHVVLPSRFVIINEPTP
jgi:hypothetical protein